jgi:DHA2 family multidrug resistance protein-like MFS transporter
MPQTLGTVASAPRAGRREWIGLGVIALPCLLYSMDLTVLNLALPSLSADLQPSSAELLWIVDIYGFLVAGALITMGTLGDRIGRRRLLLIGAAAFGVASAIAAFSTSARMLIAMRALLGLAGATLAPSTLSLIRNLFPDPAQRTVAIGVWISSFSAGAAIGPVIGGVLLQYFWWGSVFLISVPVMVLLLVLGPLLLPEYRDPDAGKLDVTSAALSLVAVLATIYGLKRVAEDGLEWPHLMAIGAGIGLGAIFLRRQSRLADPMIDLRLFRTRAFSAALATYTFGTFAAFGIFLFVTQHMQLVLGMTPLEAGLWTTPFAMAFIVGSMLTPGLVRRHPPGTVLAAGLAMAAAGFGLLVVANDSTGAWGLAIAFVVYSLGLAPVFTLATDLIVGSAPPERAGAASAISETGSEFGGALGIAVLGSLGTAVYRSSLADALPAGIPPRAATAPQETLGGAAAAAGRLPAARGAALIDAARDAFARAFDLTAAVSAFLLLGLAVVAWMMLRGVQPRPHVDPAQESAPAAVAS